MRLFLVMVGEVGEPPAEPTTRHCHLRDLGLLPPVIHMFCTQSLKLKTHGRLLHTTRTTRREVKGTTEHYYHNMPFTHYHSIHGH